MRNKFFKLLTIFIFLIFFPLEFMPAFSDDGTTVIKIENAQKTEYKKNEETDEDEIILSGAVSVSVTKGSSVTTICFAPRSSRVSKTARQRILPLPSS